MAEVNRFPTWFRVHPRQAEARSRSAPQVGFSSVCGHSRADRHLRLVSPSPFRTASTVSHGRSTAPLPSLEPSLRLSRREAFPMSRGSAVIAAGLLERGLEVRLRGLQSIFIMWCTT